MFNLPDEGTNKAAQQEYFCPNSDSAYNPCGDPVTDGMGRVYFTHRRMNYVRTETGWLGSKTAVYECPVCKRQHRAAV
jgi:hypothetical protein